MTLRPYLALGTIGLLVSASSGNAQTFPGRQNAATSRPVSQQLFGLPGLSDTTSPQEPRRNAGSFPTTQTDDPAVRERLSDQPLLPSLNGLVIEERDRRTEPDPGSAVTTRSVPLLDENDFRRSLIPYLHKPASARTFYDIGQLITARFRKEGRPFVTAVVLPQRVQNGILHVTVVEYRLGRIDVRGNRWFSDRVIREASNLVSGQTLSLRGLQTDLSWMNGNPFLTVDMIYHPGATSGVTDVTLQVADRFPVYVFGSFNNQADPTLGRVNWSTGATWGNVFGLNHTLSYQFTRSLSARYNMHLGSWEIPLPWRDKIIVFGTYSESAPEAAWPLRNSGYSAQTSIRYLHQLPHLAVTSGIGLDTLLHAGFDWKLTNSDQFYVSSPVMLGKSDTDQFVLGTDTTETDTYGQMHLINETFYGPGGLTGHDNLKSYATIFPSARTNYVYDRFQISRTTNLPYGFSSLTVATAQATTHNLLYSEQLEAGGMGSVRGYYVNTALGSRGIQASEELKLPSFSVSQKLGLGDDFSDNETIGGFYDWGETWNDRTQYTTSHKTALASLGVDLNAKINRIANVTFDTGWRLRPAPTSRKKGAFLDFNVVFGF
ncbi:ShlB/FhaC/HecB family hemolysin secretion/activation protein [Acetobacter tropicalis]|uniref:Haemolysin activator HlyB C-terminal domain-containing protein n=1 Tax=Acetobacter tropicalis TaxID=104102 RepID=A0A511FSB9_9PROT|nr:ShlB/FhaC/HecB family hemolysin secretion/activation protein [Acetobacter tropicalis]KXV51546.1 hypothetical protein AD944_01485 [Acetobacter tropicalis]GEL51810.1 hypothetical protein ATR01nite_28850 [Acetobacter tropicalis]